MKISVVGLRGFPKVQGGIETHCENLYPRLAKNGLNITIYGRKIYRVDDSSDVRTIWLPCFHNQYFETISYMLFAFFRILFNKPKIVHIHGIGPALFTPLFRLIGCKVVLTHHGADYERGKWGFIAKVVLKIGEKAGLKFANKIIALNECGKNKLACLPYAKKISVIPNGVELPKQKNNGQGKFIFAIGRFVKEKGFDDLLDALRFVEAIHCVIAGKPDHENAYFHNLTKKAKELGVELPGFVQGEAKEKLFLECGLFVIPSHHEGLPFTLLEAMSYGCNILASDIPEHKELGLPEECYFPCSNVKILAEKIKSHKSFNNYDEILKEKYDWEKIAQRTMGVYSEV
jgi:glycosyltransferase involved in cell wall biosynthesis